MSIGNLNTEADLMAFVRREVNNSPVGVLVRQLQGKLRWGTGSPENVVAAPVGTAYLREDGGASTTWYVKESGGSGDTGWVAK